MNKITIGLMVGLLLVVTLVSGAVTNNGNGTWTLSFTFSTDNAVRINNAFAGNYNYQEQICEWDDQLEEEVCIDNPQTKVEFTESKIKQFIKENVDSWETKEAERIARESVTGIGDSEIE